MTLRHITIMAGGTGGHVFPGLAIAAAFRKRGVETSWLGGCGGMEADWVRKADLPFAAIDVRGVRGKGLKGLSQAPGHIWKAFRQANAALAQWGSQAVLGMGGYVCGPGALAAKYRHLPLYLHEQNAIPGLTNQLLAPFSRQVFAAFPFARKPLRGRVLLTGNPVRAEIERVPPLSAHRPLHLLVVGGSRGARALNELVPAALARLPEARRPKVWHQTGELTWEVARAAYDRAGVKARIVPFIEDMVAAYGWADLVICRAGALTVSELMTTGRPALMVPFPHAVDDHQRWNAQAMVDAGGGACGACLRQDALTPQMLAETLQAWLDPARLNQAGEALRQRRQTGVADRIVERILEDFRER